MSHCTRSTKISCMTVLLRNSIVPGSIHSPVAPGILIAAFGLNRRAWRDTRDHVIAAVLTSQRPVRESVAAALLPRYTATMNAIVNRFDGVERQRKAQRLNTFFIALEQTLTKLATRYKQTFVIRIADPQFAGATLRW